MVALAQSRFLTYITPSPLSTYNPEAHSGGTCANADGALYHDPNQSRSTSIIHSRQWTHHCSVSAEWRSVPPSLGIAWVAIPVCTTLITERRKHGMMELARKFWDDESGQGLAEYALLLGLIVVGVVILIQGMGISIKNIFGRANTELGKAAATP